MFQEENKAIVYYGNTKIKKSQQYSNKFRFLNSLTGGRKELSDVTLSASTVLTHILLLDSWNSWMKMIKIEVTEMS